MANIKLTAFGLSALAAALSGGYNAPIYFVIDTTHALITTGIGSGVSTVATSIRVDQAGDTQIVLGPGLASQEIVTFTSVTGTGPFTYHLSGTTANAHLLNDPVIRNPRPTVDTLASIINELEYDPTNAPSQRVDAVTGFAGTAGVWTTQIYLTGIQANGYIGIIGFADTEAMGTGNLHAIGFLGFDHSFTGSTTDIEIDITITIANA